MTTPKTVDTCKCGHSRSSHDKPSYDYPYDHGEGFCKVKKCSCVDYVKKKHGGVV